MINSIFPSIFYLSYVYPDLRAKNSQKKRGIPAQRPLSLLLKITLKTPIICTETCEIYFIDSFLCGVGR